MRAMLYEHVPFFETAFIEQHVDPLTRREFALGVLALDTGLAAAHSCRLASRF